MKRVRKEEEYNYQNEGTDTGKTGKSEIPLNESGLGLEEQSQAILLFDRLIWMTSADAARYLRMSESALRNAVHRGKLPYRKWRRRLYFRRTELDRVLDSSSR